MMYVSIFTKMFTLKFFNMKRLFFIFFFYIMLINIYCQTISPPNDDKNWNTTSIFLNDEFKFFDSSKWMKLNSSYQWGQEIFQTSKVQIDPTGTGTLNLVMNKVLQSDGSYKYYSGGITTGNHVMQSGFNYPFGYYEIRYQLPYGKGLWPAFWLFGSDPYCDYCYSSEHPNGERRSEEIDILENPDMGGPSDRPNWGVDNYLGYNWHYTYSDCSMYHKSDNNYPYEGLFPAEIELPGTNMSNTFHTIALEWLPGIMVFYFDNIPIVEVLYENMIPHCNRKEILITHQVQSNFFVDEQGNQNYNNWGPDCDGKTTPNTATFSIDYIRVFELENDDDDIDEIIENQSDLSNFTYSLKKSITINQGSNVVVPANESISLRAVENITINGDFEVPLGCGFIAIVHDSPPPLGPSY